MSDNLYNARMLLNSIEFVCEVYYKIDNNSRQIILPYSKMSGKIQNWKLYFITGIKHCSQSPKHYFSFHISNLSDETVTCFCTLITFE